MGHTFWVGFVKFISVEFFLVFFFKSPYDPLTPYLLSTGDKKNTFGASVITAYLFDVGGIILLNTSIEEISSQIWLDLHK